MSETSRTERRARVVRAALPPAEGDSHWLDVLVQRDGVVGAWYRWVSCCAAAVVLLGYMVSGVLGWALVLLLDAAPRELLDPHLLLLTVPLGVLLGDVGYQRDYDLNHAGLPAAETPEDKQL